MGKRWISSEVVHSFQSIQQQPSLTVQNFVSFIVHCQIVRVFSNYEYATSLPINFTASIKDVTPTFTSLDFTFDLAYPIFLSLAKGKLPEDILIICTQSLLRPPLKKFRFLDIQQLLEFTIFQQV